MYTKKVVFLQLGMLLKCFSCAILTDLLFFNQIWITEGHIFQGLSSLVVLVDEGQTFIVT